MKRAAAALLVALACEAAYAGSAQSAAGFGILAGLAVAASRRA